MLLEVCAQYSKQAIVIGAFAPLLPFCVDSLVAEIQCLRCAAKFVLRLVVGIICDAVLFLLFAVVGPKLLPSLAAINPRTAGGRVVVGGAGGLIGAAGLKKIVDRLV